MKKNNKGSIIPIKGSSIPYLEGVFNMKNVSESDKRLLSYINVLLLSNRLETIMDKNLKEISTKQWIALIMLGTFENPPTLKELAKKCGITHQSTMQLVKKLQSKGYVTIVTDEKDRRAIRIIATDKRDKWTDQYAEENMQNIETLFSDLTEREIEIFCKAQLKMYERLEIMEKELKI